MNQILRGNHNFKQKRYFEALELYTHAGANIDAQLLSYNIFKCQELLSSHTSSLKAPWAYSYFDNEILDKKSVSKKYVAGIASMPSRITTLELVINDVLPQVDAIHIFLNNYDTIPEFLLNKKIVVYRSQDFGDQRDNGKFFGLKNVDNDSYYFTLDDDIRYPHGYFNLLAHKLLKYKNAVAVGVHGVIYAPAPRSFFDRITLNFERELVLDVPVSLLGTGTTGFYTGAVKPPFEFFKSTGMADLFFGSFLKNSKIPAVCVQRPKKWLREYDRADRTDTIYHETKALSTPYDDFLALNSPWGCRPIREALHGSEITVCRQSDDFIMFVESLPLNYITKQQFDISHANFFETAGLFALSDDYYIIKAKELIASKLSRTKNIESFSQQLALLLFPTTGLEPPVQIPPNDELMLEQVELWNTSTIKSYARESYNPELTLLVEILQTFDVPSASKARLLDITNGLINIGLSNGVCNLYNDGLLSTLDTPTLYKLFSASILERSEFRYKLLPHFYKTKGNDNTYIFLNALYETGENSDQAEHATLEVVLGRYKTKNKSKHLVELFRFANEVGTPILPKSKFKLMLQNYVDTAIKKVIFDAILLQEGFDHPDSGEALIENIDQFNFDSFELQLRIAEIRRQFSRGASDVIAGINDCFLAWEMAPINRREGKLAFLQSLVHSTDLTGGADHGLCTVIIAAYNAEDTLQYAYDSICNQNYGNLEVIIVDDYSDLEVISYLVLNPLVRTQVIRNASNEGPYGCRNVAAKVMRGEYFVIHDADDWAHPEKITMQIHSIVDSSYVCSYGRHVRITPNGALKLENNGSLIGHGPMTSLFKSTVLRDIGEFDAVSTRGDMEFKARIIKFYGIASIYEDPRILLLSLDWHSNSKQHTSSLNKAFKLGQYKQSYSRRHSLLPFIRLRA